MKLTLPQIASAVQKKEITAISLDTSIFDGKQRGLEWGVLRHMQQFRNGPASFLLADIVSRELHRHLVRDTQDSLAALKKALKEAATPWRVVAAEKDAFFAQVHRDLPPEQMAQLRLDEYITATGATVIKAADHADLGEVIHRYFTPLPPFGTKEAKKNEFPDALALLTLEAWCKEAETKMLVVTADGDWQAFAAESEHLVAHADLAEALGCFQEEAAQFACREIERLVAGGDQQGVVARVIDAVRSAADTVDVDVDADSQFRVEPDVSEVTFPTVEIEPFRLEPVEFGEGYLVAQIQVEVTAEIITYFGFSKRDPIDRDYLSLGSGRAFAEEHLVAEVLVTFAGDLLRNPEIEQIEVLPISVSVQHTDLEPDWMSNPENFAD